MKTLITLAIAILSSNVLFSQNIPNPGFESWTNPNGYNIPDGWATLNDVTAPSNVYTCTKGTPGSPGTSYIKLTSKNVAGLGVVPAIAVSGTMNPSTMQPISGFAYNMRPTALAGKWQYMGASGTDIGFISAVLTKWNMTTQSRDTVGFGSKDLIDMEMAWVNFSIPFTYNTNDNPDSCIIVMSASGPSPLQNSYLYVDNLSFTNPTQGLANLNTNKAFVIYPNPASDRISIDLSSINTADLRVSILDAVGKTCVYNFTQKRGVLDLELSHLTAGIYIITIQNSDQILTQQFIKQ